MVKRLYIPLPTCEARKQFLLTILDPDSHTLEQSDINNIIKITKGE